MNVLLTGATGFLGSRLAAVLRSKPDVILTAAVRRRIEIPVSNIVEVQGLDANTEWSSILINQQVVIHAAARAHIMKDEVADPMAEYRRINVDGTLKLARQAAAAGVKRFIFISSIKVNGEHTSLETPFTCDDTPAPKDAYGISKWEAEQCLRKVAVDTGMEFVIIRPALVYGLGAKGNFANLIKIVEKGIPLPFGAIYNKRSLVSLDNLVDLIITCTIHPKAANQIFLAADGQDLSTTELLRAVAQSMCKPSCLVPVPSFLLILAATMLGKRAMTQRLLGSLQVDISKARDLLNWTPPLSLEEGLRRCFIDKTERY